MEKVVKIIRIIGLVALIIGVCLMVYSKIYISNREKSGEQPLYESEFTVQSVEKIREVKTNPRDPQLIDPYDYKYTGVLSSGKTYSITVDSEGEFKVGETYKVYSPDNKAWRTDKAFGFSHSKSDKILGRALLWSIVGGCVLIGVSGTLEKYFCK